MSEANKTPQSQGQNQQEVKAKAEQSAKAKAEAEAKAKVHKPLYDKYAELKFIQLDGGKLKDAFKKDLEAKEKELKTYKGLKGKKNRTVVVGMVKIRIVEGIALPQEYADLIKKNKLEKNLCEN